jgi:hypothetical protein
MEATVKSSLFEKVLETTEEEIREERGDSDEPELPRLPKAPRKKVTVRTVREEPRERIVSRPSESFD